MTSHIYIYTQHKEQVDGCPGDGQVDANWGCDGIYKSTYTADEMSL